MATDDQDQQMEEKQQAGPISQKYMNANNNISLQPTFSSFEVAQQTAQQLQQRQNENNSSAMDADDADDDSDDADDDADDADDNDTQTENKENKENEDDDDADDDPVDPVEFQNKKEIMVTFLTDILDSWDSKKKEMNTNEDALKIKGEIFDALDSLVKFQMRHEEWATACCSQQVMLQMLQLFRWFRGQNGNPPLEEMFTLIKIE